jgi:hypothetical protein
MTYLVAIPLSILLVPYASPISILMWLVGLWGLFGTPYRRLGALWQGLNARDKAAALLWVPLIRLTGDAAKMIGYPVGLWWRLRRQAAEAAP